MSNCALHWTGRCFATLVLTSPREGQTVLLRAGLARERTEQKWR